MTLYTLNCLFLSKVSCMCFCHSEEKTDPAMLGVGVPANPFDFSLMAGLLKVKCFLTVFHARSLLNNNCALSCYPSIIDKI